MWHVKKILNVENIDNPKKVSKIDKVQIEGWVRSAFTMCGLSINDYRWAIEYSDRMTACMGWASQKQIYDGNRLAWTYVMAFSIPLYERATEQQQYQTAIHEACHIIDYIGGSHGHGKSWKKLMVQCGVEPLLYHNVDRTGLKNVVPCKCDCGTWTTIGKIRANRIRKCADAYRCRTCKSTIELI